MKRTFIAGVVFTAMLMATTGSAAAVTNPNLIKDGGFEKPKVPEGTYKTFTPGGTFSSWSVFGPEGNVAVVSTTFTSNGLSFPAKRGKQWLDLTGDCCNTTTGVAQTVATVPSSTYRLSYWSGNQYDPNGTYGVTSTVNVHVNGVFQPNCSGTNSKTSTTNTQVWEHRQCNIMAAASSITLEFVNGDPSTDFHNGLDAVSFKKTT
jgi:hypothetical protein